MLSSEAAKVNYSFSSSKAIIRSLFSCSSFFKLLFKASSFCKRWAIELKRSPSLPLALRPAGDLFAIAAKSLAAPWRLLEIGLPLLAAPPCTFYRPAEIGIPPGPLPGPVIKGLRGCSPLGPSSRLISCAILRANLSSSKSEALSRLKASATLN